MWLGFKHSTRFGQVFGVSSALNDNGGERVECRYYVSSLSGVSAEEMARRVRRHWSIENECHWVLDVVFKDDASRVQRGAKNVHTIRQIAMRGARAYKDTLEKPPRLRRLLKQAGWNNEIMLQLLQTL